MTARPDLADEFDRLADNQQPPRSNGELIFSEPWQARAFGMVVAMHDQGLFAWDAFRDRLIARIGAAAPDPDGGSYYERWLEALEDVISDEAILSPAEVAERTREITIADQH